jgi:hypothetical protein
MPHPDRNAIKRIAVRSFASAVLTVGAGAVIYMTMGGTIISAMFFALACGIISVATSYI